VDSETKTITFFIETHKEESNHTTTCEKVENKLEKALEKIIVDPKIKVLKKCRSS